MNVEKSKAYKKLVQTMQEKYPKYDRSSSNDYELYAPYVNGEMICQEINLYTYWQGLGYEKNTPKIKYLFVAQDWGSLFVEDENLNRFLERIRKINNGCKDIPYFDEKYNSSLTDENLVKLFDNFGHDLNERNPDLFFTNFCLGYRRDKEVKMTRELMMNDSAIFKELFKILEPENIITMGMRTFQCVYETLKGEPYSGIKNFNNFIDIVSSHKKIFIKRGRKTVPIYPINHCGKHGIENIIFNPLVILQGEMKPIFENSLSLFAEYLFKLIDEYKSKYNKTPKISSKLLSDLRCGKTNAPLKRTILYIMYILKLPIQEAAELMTKSGYDFVGFDYTANDKSLDDVIEEEINKNFIIEPKKVTTKEELKKLKEMREKLNDKLFEISIIHLIKQQDFNMKFNDITETIDEKFYFAELKREKERIREELKQNFIKK